LYEQVDEPPDVAQGDQLARTANPVLRDYVCQAVERDATERYFWRGIHMHGRIPIWLAGGLAAMVLGNPTFAWGQYEQLTDPAAPAITALQPGQAQGQFVSATLEAAPEDLAARVQKLEEALKKAEEKAKADKKKAAGKPTAELGGRVYFDHVFNSQDALNHQTYGNATNGTEFRTMRLKAQGKAFEVVDYKAELDFANSNAVFKDIYIGVSELPVVGNLRAGHFKEPMGLEELTSASYTTFMERSMGNNAFLPARNTGLMLFDWDEDRCLTWQAGMFDTDIADNPSTRAADELSQSFTGRVTWAPWYDVCTDGRGLLHTGGSYSYRHPYHNSRTFSSRADEHIGISYINTGALSLSDYQVFACEAALVYGPFSIQSEYFHVLADPTAAGRDDMHFNAAYVTVSYFLTGEHRPYRRDMGVFDRVKPFENFFRVRAEDGCVYTGKGAWELAYRFDYCDVGEAGPTAGMVGSSTYGVNWYLNPYTRMMFNYVHADTHRNYTDAGSLDAFLTRFQIDF
jgi:phosphate-selective porin OprO/OprP